MHQTNINDSSCKSFEKYEECPNVLGLDITGDDVSEMAPKLKGAAGPASVYAITELREEMAHWTEWLANTSPPWAAYRATMASCLVAMDKMPEVRPVGIGEIYHRLWAKLVIKDCGSQAKLSCGTSELCAGLEAGIEGAIHSVH